MDAFEALVLNLSTEELDVKGEFGSTLLMILLNETVISVQYIRQHEDWLGRGASWLPFDGSGNRVSQTLRGKRRHFAGMIAAQVRGDS